MKIVAVSPVRKPKPSDLLSKTFSLELIIFLSIKMLIAAAPGTSKQQLKFFIPGTVERTAAPNPETIAGRYFLKFMDFFL